MVSQLDRNNMHRKSLVESYLFDGGYRGESVHEQGEG